MGTLDELPIDLWQLIAKKIADHIDVLRFAAVCSKFRSIVMDNLHLLPPKLPLCLCAFPSKPPLPLLMQCRDDEWENINFYSISDGRNHGEFIVPEIRNKWIAGSSHGWLCTVDIQGGDIQLLNPLTRAQIPLPSLDAFEHPDHGISTSTDDDFGCVSKVVILSNPSNKRRNLDDDDCILAMAIFSRFCVLSFCRDGDDKWTNVEDCLTHIDDAIYYEGQIYGVNYEGIVVVYDLSGDKKMKQIANSPDDYIDVQRYLVESTYGELLQVVRVLDHGGGVPGSPKTEEFFMYKLEAVEKPVEPEPEPEYTIVRNRKRVPITYKFNFEWVEMESLGDQALFLGKNYSHCVRAAEHEGCKPNCIYFTEHGLCEHLKLAWGGLNDDRDVDKNYFVDMGIYNLGDKSFQAFSQLDVKYQVPPIWISPNPW